MLNKLKFPGFNKIDASVVKSLSEKNHSIFNYLQLCTKITVFSCSIKVCGKYNDCQNKQTREQH